MDDPSPLFSSHIIASHRIASHRGSMKMGAPSRSKIFARRRHAQAGLDDTGDTAQGIGQRPYFPRRTPNQDGFRTVVMGQMHMRGAQDQVVMFMLGRQQGITQGSSVMVIDQGDGAQGLAIISAGLLGQMAMDEIADELGAVAIPGTLDGAFKPFGELGFEGKRDAFAIGHDRDDSPARRNASIQRQAVRQLALRRDLRNH